MQINDKIEKILHLYGLHWRGIGVYYPPDMKLNKLTKEEKGVILDKETEPPFTGEYDNFFREGIYLCRRCNTPLYKSENKFEAHCGWPSFDEEIPGRVKKQPDPDGRRTEIICAACGAHLGHVFTGEELTPKDTRYCVNSLSLRFIPKDKTDKYETAVFGGGCFWCFEAIFRRLRGVESVASGYAGGKKENPTYEEVSTGETGHAEVVKIVFDPNIISYGTLLEIFFALHDPTTPDRQGADTGPQYRSMILYATAKQKETAEKYLEKIKKGFTEPVVTEIEPLIRFYPAEEYHRDYYEKHQDQPYCEITIPPKLKKLEEKFSKLLKS